MVQIKLQYIFTVFALSVAATCLYFSSYQLNNLNLKIISILEKKEDKLVCMILTIENNFETRGLAIWNTWAKNCDKILFACNCSNFQKNKNYTDVPILQLNITEDYNLMAGKTLEALKLAYRAYGVDHHWFLLVD
jgi:hypothetical protein